MCSSSPVRTPKLQWAVGQLLTGGRWNPSPEKDTPCSKTKEKPQWHGRRGAIMIKSNPTSSRCTTHKLENNSTKEPAKVLGPKTDIPTWGSGKGIGNPQGIWLWRTEAFDYSTLKGLGETETLGGHKKNPMFTRTQGKGVVTHKRLSQTCHDCLRVVCRDMVSSGLPRGQGHWPQQTWEV